MISYFPMTSPSDSVIESTSGSVPHIVAIQDSTDKSSATDMIEIIRYEAHTTFGVFFILHNLYLAR